MTAHIGYGFVWEINTMPSRSILEIFTEDEQENFLDLDRHFNLDWDSYDIMGFSDFENMMRQVLIRLSGESKPSVTMMIAGEWDLGIDSRGVFVVSESIISAMFHQIAEVPATGEVQNDLLNKLMEYFPGVEAKWLLWGYTV